MEISQLKKLVPVSSSPYWDWYIKIPQSSFLLLPLALHLRFDDDWIVAEFFPSTTTACTAEAVPVVLIIVISPVEYIKGLPAPPVDKVQSVQGTVTSPQSAAKVAHEPPIVEIVAVIIPP